MTKIALDAGHGIYTEDRRILEQFDENETREWELNSRICEKVRRMLAFYDDCQVIRLDDENGGEINVPLKKRCERANEFNADVVISIHHNIGIEGGNGGGISAFSYTGSTEGAKLRDALYERLIDYTGLIGNRANPLQESNFYILKHTNAPATLFELGFMDSAADAPIIVTDEYAESCARAIADALAEKYGLTKRELKLGERYQSLVEIPEWGYDAVRRLILKGYLKGKNSGLDLSEDMVRILVILDRAGVFE